MADPVSCVVCGKRFVPSVGRLWCSVGCEVYGCDEVGMSDTQKDIIEAIEANDFNRLRDISACLSGGKPGDQMLAKRVRLAAAIIEVSKIGDDLVANDEHALGGFRMIEDAVEECGAATGAIWPSGQFVLIKWLLEW